MFLASALACPGRILRVLIVAVALAPVSITAHAQTPSEAVTISPAARLGLGIETVEARTAMAADGVVLTGEIVVPPHSRRALVAPATMIVAETLVLPGQRVSTDDPVQVLYSPVLEGLRAQLDVLGLEAEHAQELAQRAEALLEAGLTTGEDLHERRLTATATRLELAAMRARFGAFESGSEAGQFLVRATADGVLAEINTEPGFRLEEGAVIFAINTDDTVWARLHVPARLSDGLSVGSEIRVPGVSGTGQIMAIDSMIDPARRAVTVHVALPDGVSERPGSLIDVLFPVTGERQGLSLPARAIVRLAGEDHVFIDRGETFQAVAVRVLTRTRDAVTVEPGTVTEGDQVAISGLAALKNQLEGG